MDLRCGGILKYIFSDDEKIDKNNPKILKCKIDNKVYSNLANCIK